MNNIFMLLSQIKSVYQIETIYLKPHLEKVIKKSLILDLNPLQVYIKPKASVIKIVLSS